MKSPYPWFGGKSTIMPQVWKRLGDTQNFVDPFMGSNAPLLSRSEWDWHKGGWGDGKNRIETANDKDGFVSNFWRALAADPAEVAKWADWPVNELDLHARHSWLVNETGGLAERLRAEPDYYDAKVAGWWVWGLCSWIGSGWCSELHQKHPNLGDAGRGINRTSQPTSDIYTYFDVLSSRLRRVRVCCGDWSRVLGPTPTHKNGLTAVILDPPYSAEAGRDNNLYAQDDLTVAHKVREWAIANGDNPLLRIALFGYEDEHTFPENWECLAWKANGGYANRSDIDRQGRQNSSKERVWFSPHCLRPEQVRQISIF